MRLLVDIALLGSLHAVGLALGHAVAHHVHLRHVFLCSMRVNGPS